MKHGKDLAGRLRVTGEVEVPLTRPESDLRKSPEWQLLVDDWPAERIKGLPELLTLPVRRIVALLAISQPTFSRLASGDFTPAPSLCHRMNQLMAMHERGELHGDREYMPRQAELRRRMSLFRAWWLAKAPTQQMPLVTCHIRFVWGKGPTQRLELPVEHFPALRLKEWGGVVEVVREVTKAMRRIAKANAALLWKHGEEEFWRQWAEGTLPRIVAERAELPLKAIRRRQELIRDRAAAGKVSD